MLPSENEPQGEEEYNDSHGNILTQEVDSWNNYEYALREENRLLFNKMLSARKMKTW